jgi:transposase-like protein
MGSLPPDNTKRWVARRKAAVVAAVHCGELTLEQACRRYQLSEEEFRSWERAYDTHGLAGLRVTRCQQYRVRSPSRARRGMPKQPAERPAQPSAAFLT